MSPLRVIGAKNAPFCFQLHEMHKKHILQIHTKAYLQPTLTNVNEYHVCPGDVTAHRLRLVQVVSLRLNAPPCLYALGKFINVKYLGHVFCYEKLLVRAACVCYLYTQSCTVSQRPWVMCLHKDGLCCAHVTNRSLSVNPASLPCDPIRFHNKSLAHSQGGRAMPSVLWDPRDGLSLCASCTYTAPGQRALSSSFCHLEWPTKFFYSIFINGKSLH